MEITAAVVKEKSGPFVVTEDLILDDPRPDEVLVRLVASGVCHTDVFVSHIADTPAVLGHEGAGIVEQVGSNVTAFAPGDRVIMSYASCGTCRRCRQGDQAYCENMMPLNFSGRRPDGSKSIHTADGQEVSGNFFGQSSFATYSLVNERNLVRVPDSVSDELLPLLAPLGCGVQTGAGTVLNTFRPELGSTIVVAGAGAVGLSAVLGAVVARAQIIVAIDIVPSRLELALELGATHTINGLDDNVAEQLAEATRGGADFAIDTSGNMKVIRALAESTKAGGTVGLVGGGRPGSELVLDHASLINGPIIRGIIQGGSIPQAFLPELIRLHLAGQFPFDKLVTTYPFADIQQAMHDSEVGSTVKAVLTF